MKIKLIKIIDHLVGSIITVCLPPVVMRPLSTPRRILLIRPGGIGDAVLLAPSIYAIKKSFPDTRITILAENRNCDIFTLIPYVDSVLRYDIPRELCQVLLGKFDVVIDTEQWYRLSAVVARLVRSPIKIGFGTNERRRMFTHVIEYDQTVYEPDMFTSLLKPLGINCGHRNIDTVLLLSNRSVVNADQMLLPLELQPFVVIFPGSSSMEKRWGAMRFKYLAVRLLKTGYGIVAVGGQNDRSDGDVITKDLGLNLAGMTTLSETAAVIARSDLVISGDSGVLHIAAGLGIPTIALFGPSSSKKWAPRGEKHIVLNRQLSCSPCTKFGTTPPCPHGVLCMNEITADQVVEAAVRLLRKI